MVVAAKELRSQPHIGCFAHCLNLAAQKALKINSVTKILAKVRRIVSFFHRSSTAAVLLKAKIKLTGLKELKLIQDVATRWNSAADMLERYLLQPAIYATFLSKELNKQESDLSTLNETDTRMAEDIMETLLPMREITTAICTEKMPAVSVILPLLKRLTKTMQTDTNDSAVKRQVKQAIMENISTRYTSVELQDFLQECTILDPRFKLFFEYETQFTILNRLVSLALSSVSGNTVKVEKEEATKDVSPTQTSLTPTLPVLPQLPQMSYPLCKCEDIDGSMQVDAPMVTSTSENKKGLAAVPHSEDIVIVKETKGTKSQIQIVKEEIERYQEMPEIGLDEHPLLWWKKTVYFFPI